MNNNTSNTPKGKKPNRRKFRPMWIYIGIFAMLLGTYFFTDMASPVKELDWNKFQKAAINGAYSKILVDRQNATVIATVKPDKVDSIFKSGDLPANMMRQKMVEYKTKTVLPSVDAFAKFGDQYLQNTEIKYEESKFNVWSLLISFGPLILLIFFWVWWMRRMTSGGGGNGGVFSAGKSKAKLYDNTGTKITFADVAGQQEAKQEVEEIVHFLKNSKKYTELGGRIPKGALLVGPPGTGKTLLAKAVAGEAHVPFFSMSGADFVEMFVGVGASRVRDLFKQAKEKAPCIVFIDEIDAIGRARGKNGNFGGNDERESTLNQLLTEMDGFDGNSGVIILAATNRADVLDKALLRAGRFDRQIYVDLPDLNDRKEIFLVHLKPLKTDNSVDVDLLAKQTPGFSGADIANVCNEAALIAARNEKQFVGWQDFMNAVDRIIGGLEKKNKITTEEERRSIAIHEAGHATVSWMLEFGNPLVKVTIVPRGKALGAAWYLPEERQITTTQALLDQMCSLLGGRAAEELFLGRISTGAANDLERVTRLAYAMVSVYGMSDKLPNLNYYAMQQDGYNFAKPYSEKTAEMIDVEASRIIEEQYNRAKEILQEYKEGHSQIAELLISREVIYTDDVAKILGKRKWTSRADELMEINELKRKEEAAKKAVEASKETEDGAADDSDGMSEGAGTSETENLKPGETIILPAKSEEEKDSGDVSPSEKNPENEQ